MNSSSQQLTVQADADRVRSVDKTTGKAVPDAVIFATRLDMARDGMQQMVTKVTPMPDSEPATFRFKATFSMAGRWQLSLGAKVQGETGTVENKLVVTAWPALPLRALQWQASPLSPASACDCGRSPAPL